MFIIDDAEICVVCVAIVLVQHQHKRRSSKYLHRRLCAKIKGLWLMACVYKKNENENTEQKLNKTDKKSVRRWLWLVMYGVCESPASHVKRIARQLHLPGLCYSQKAIFRLQKWYKCSSYLDQISIIMPQYELLQLIFSWSWLISIDLHFDVFYLLCLFNPFYCYLAHKFDGSAITKITNSNTHKWL